VLSHRRISLCSAAIAASAIHFLMRTGHGSGCCAQTVALADVWRPPHCLLHGNCRTLDCAAAAKWLAALLSRNILLPTGLSTHCCAEAAASGDARRPPHYLLSDSCCKSCPFAARADGCARALRLLHLVMRGGGRTLDFEVAAELCDFRPPCYIQFRRHVPPSGCPGGRQVRTGAATAVTPGGADGREGRANAADGTG